jgi:hypothetical protein
MDQAELELRGHPADATVYPTQGCTGYLYRKGMTRRKLARRAPDLTYVFCASAVRVEPDRIHSGIHGAS